jgi:ribonuclease E
MANKMLIDATHPEETRVVVLRGNRVEEFDFESANRKQLRGNIYLAKVTRVEPSLQAAFVDYGGNRHGFLAFSEIHPDYYQIPVADRQALIDEEERAHRAAEAEADRRAGGRSQQRPHHRAAERTSEIVQSEPGEDELAGGEPAESETIEGEAVHESAPEAQDITAIDTGGEPMPSSEQPSIEHAEHDQPVSSVEPGEHQPDVMQIAGADDQPAAPEGAPEMYESAPEAPVSEPVHGEEHGGGESAGGNGEAEEEEIVESVGGADAMEEVPDRMPRLRRQYKIQEVIKRRQIMLVQVVKEERGTKGAALTTYLSLAGRYSVLMPNTARGGGISRKITNPLDRKRLKEVAQELEVPEGMGVILRTAGASRTKTEIKRDFEYLLRMWETVRDVTLKSTAPMLVYEEGSLVKRSIRDLYNKEIDEVVVAGDAAYKEARDFMRMLMPSHASNVKPYHESQPILTRYGIESQLDAMFSPVVQLRSGGYIVINQAEALVAIDVNSGRATREHHIEDTALKTNLEAAEEIARQLRLRDLAGLIVIDFIDMDEKRNNRSVERRLKECLKNDRARIQVGRISHFGLLEMSRQRIRTSVLESSTDKCPHCGGTGHVRSVASVALQVLRMIEETLLRGATHNLAVRTRADIAIYVLNHKRAHLRELEERFRITVTVNADAAMGGQTPFVIERGEQVHSLEQARAIAAEHQASVPVIEPEEEPVVEEEFEEGEAESEEMMPEVAPEDGARGDFEGARRRRRRRRRGRRGEGRDDSFAHETVAEHAIAHEDHNDGEDEEAGAEDEAPAGASETREPHGDGEGDMRRRRRRGRRGGRRNRRGREGEPSSWGDESRAPVEPEVAAAVADFGGPPVQHHEPSEPSNAPEPAAHAPEPAAHAPEPAPAALTEPAAPEPPRRRSTVREPVVFATEEGVPQYSPPTPQPAPPAAEPQAEQERQDEAGKPRRTGWWAKRMLGGS